MEYARKIYNFTGMAFEDKIKRWIATQLASSANGSDQNLFSTAKNPTQASYHSNQKVRLFYMVYKQSYKP